VCGIKRTKRKAGLVLLVTCAFIFLYVKIYWILQPGNVTKTCVLRKFDFNHRSFSQTFWKESPKDCNKWESLIHFDEQGMLQLNQTALNTSGHSNIKCSYSSIHFNGQNDVVFSERIVFEFPVFVPNDFVHVICTNLKGHSIYSNLHNKVYNLDVINHQNLQNETEDQLSVVILGIDSVSSLVANRMLHQTLPYLQNDLKAYFISRYTKVGDNTLVNLAAALLGKSLPELLALAIDLPILFKDIKEKGYIDCYAEDWAPYQPTVGLHFPQYTHNLRKFILARQKVDLYLKEKYNVTKSKQSNTMPLCFGNRMRHNIVLEYAQQCIEAYANKRKYVFMWINEISHHQSNLVQLADQDFKSFFQWLNKTRGLDKTVVIMMSDHGPRYGPVPKTTLGRFTSRHPFLALLIPEQLTRRYPHIHTNLVTNRHRLTSPFDFHEMLKDIIHQTFALQEPLTGQLPRGISLFREIPKHRSCYDAAISEDNCPCYAYSNVSTDEANVVKIAYYTVDTINNFLKSYKGICAKLSLLSVESANVHHIPTPMIKTLNAVRYTVALQTIPGNALFEVTVNFVDKNKIYIQEEIARRNEYKLQTDCIRFQANEHYCLCTNLTRT